MSEKSERVSDWRKKMTHIVKTTMGGECSICGYDKCPATLEAHHVYPENKCFALFSGDTKALERVFDESEKCVLLCANCHREHHSLGIPSTTILSEILQVQLPVRRKRRAETIIGRPKQVHNCKDCGQTVSSGATRCVSCNSTARNTIDWPPVSYLLTRLKSTSYVQLGKELGVSDNAVRKHIKRNSK